MGRTFDDGVLTIYSAENVASPGMKPVINLVEKEQYYYGYETLGINRYYTALQAQQEIEYVVCVPGWGDISTLDICALENGNQYNIKMRQPTTDEDGIKITKLSLERVNQEYEIKTSDNTGNAS